MADFADEEGDVESKKKYVQEIHEFLGRLRRMWMEVTGRQNALHGYEHAYLEGSLQRMILSKLQEAELAVRQVLWRYDHGGRAGNAISAAVTTMSNSAYVIRTKSKNIIGETKLPEEVGRAMETIVGVLKNLEQLFKERLARTF